MYATDKHQPKLSLGAALQAIKGDEMTRSVARMQVEGAKLNAMAADTADKARALLAAALRSASAVQAVRPALLNPASRGF